MNISALWGDGGVERDVRGRMLSLLLYWRRDANAVFCIFTMYLVIVISYCMLYCYITQLDFNIRLLMSGPWYGLYSITDQYMFSN